MVKRLIDGAAHRVRRAHKFVTHDVWAFGEPGERVPDSLLAKQARVAVLLVQKFIEDQLMVRAAALAFTTALAIVPMVMLLFLIIQQFELASGIYNFIDSRIERTITFVSDRLTEEPSDGEEEPPAYSVEAATNPEPAVDPPPDETPPLEDILGPTETTDQASASEGEENADGEETTADEDEQAVADIRRKLRDILFQGVGQSGENGTDYVEELFNLAERQMKDQPLTNVFGIGILIAAAFGLMRNIEMAFTSIWSAKKDRSIFRTLSNYVTVVVLLPVVLVTVFGLTAALSNEPVMEALGPLRILLQGSRFLLVWIVFIGIYAYVPAAGVSIRYAIVGGGIAGTAWVLMSMGYVEFQIGVSRNNLIYGQFAQIPLLLVWIYFSWVIVLFGAELTYAYQYERTFALERWAKNASFAYKEAVAIRAAVEMSWRFDRGHRPLEAQEVAEKWNVPVRVVNEVLQDMKAAGIVSEVAGDPPAFQPSRSLNRIGMSEILRALRESGKEPSALRQDPALAPILAAVTPGGNGVVHATLNDVLRDYGPALVTDEEKPLLLEDDSGRDTKES